jgi:hypothetical protein
MDPKCVHYVPESSKWPEPIDQGPFPTCGLVALAMALKAQAKTSDNVVTLFNQACELKVTNTGSIFNIHHLKTILDSFHIDSTAQILKPEEYHSKIISELLQNKMVVVACDLNLASRNGFPGVAGGHRSHWALVYGYYTAKDGELKYLVCHHGRYFIWTSSELYQSNMQLPTENPRLSDAEMKALAAGESCGRFVQGDQSLKLFKFGVLSIPQQNTSREDSPQDQSSAEEPAAQKRRFK